MGMREECGYLGMHWYKDGDTCVCGQVPVDIFFAAPCTCGAHRYLMHAPDCEYLAWRRKEAQWRKEHPGILSR